MKEELISICKRASYLLRTQFDLFLRLSLRMNFFFGVGTTEGTTPFSQDTVGELKKKAIK